MYPALLPILRTATRVSPEPVMERISSLMLKGGGGRPSDAISRGGQLAAGHGIKLRTDAGDTCQPGKGTGVHRGPCRAIGGVLRITAVICVNSDEKARAICDTLAVGETVGEPVVPQSSMSCDAHSQEAEKNEQAGAQGRARELHFGKNGEKVAVVYRMPEGVRGRRMLVE